MFDKLKDLGGLMQQAQAMQAKMQELQAQLERLLREKRDGLTLIVVTHEIHFARRAADRVFILADGQVIEQGPPQQVIDRPQTERARKFLSEVLA